MFVKIFMKCSLLNNLFWPLYDSKSKNHCYKFNYHLNKSIYNFSKTLLAIRAFSLVFFVCISIYSIVDNKLHAFIYLTNWGLYTSTVYFILVVIENFIFVGKH